MFDLCSYIPDSRHPISATYNSFLVALTESGISDDSTIKKIKEKLLLKAPDPSKDKYLQGVSEVMLYLQLAKKAGILFKHDVRLRSGDGTLDEKKDVDIQISAGGFIYNIEVKTPEQEEKHLNVLSGEYLYRTSQSLGEVKAIMHEIQVLIEDGIRAKGSNCSVAQKKTQDNKAKEYLSSAQSKFPDSTEDNALNVLLISVEMNRMHAFWQYLYNPQSGLLQKNAYEDVASDKIDLVIISSMPTCHLKQIEGINPWDMTNVANIFCLNPRSKRFNSLTKPKTELLRAKLSEIIPNITSGWDYAEYEWRKEYNQPESYPLPQFEAVLNYHFPIIWASYLSK